MTPLHDRRALVRNLLPGIVLPGLIYLVASHFLSTIGALAAASSVPLLDAVTRLSRGGTPSLVSIGFVAASAASVALALWLRSPLVILAKGAATSALVGLAFAGSAAVGRPLVRTLAVHLTTEGHEQRRQVAERWRHPVAVRVFRVLSVGWGLWLLAVAAQQLAMALTIAPGTVVALEPATHGVAIVIGTAVSILYVRRRHRLHPELELLPAWAAPSR